MNDLVNKTEAAASRLELDLMPDHSVRLTLRCNSAYEAAVLYEDLTEKARSGSLVIDFGTTKLRETKSR